MRSIHTAHAQLDLLFVYGTLKRGCSAHRRFCGNAVFVAKATVRGRLHLHPRGYPVLALPPSTLVASLEWGRVEGEVLRLRDPDRSLARIDSYEGIVAGLPGQYRRLRVPVTAAGVRFAWTYAAASPCDVASLPVVPEGSWP